MANFTHQSVHSLASQYKLDISQGRHGTIPSIFGKLALTIKECRAFLTVNYYLADNKDIPSLFGYNAHRENCNL